MDLITLILFVLGLILLIFGAELLVRGASGLATSAGISPLVVGLTVVAFGTSAPELAVAIQSGIAGQTDLLLGNVVGSNIFNVLFILGISATITPLVVSYQLIRLDVPLMIGVSAMLLILAFDGTIGRIEGIVLFGGMLGYTIFSIYKSRQEEESEEQENASATSASEQRVRRVLTQIGQIIAGLALLVLGARWLVDGAVEIAVALGISELVIGLTIVAAGTSLPEVATSIIASIRGQRDIAVGNVVGSNISNILLVLGVAGIVTPGGVNVAAGALSFDLPVMIAVSLACLPIFFTGNVIARWEGALFLGYYVAYTLFLFLRAAEHDVLSTYSAVMLAFVVPITAITLLILSRRALIARHHHQETTRAPHGDVKH